MNENSEDQRALSLLREQVGRYKLNQLSNLTQLQCVEQPQKVIYNYLYK